MKIPLLVGVGAAILASAGVTQAADTAAGESHFKKNCAVCHGENAEGVAGFPALRDRDAAYTYERLMTYRARGKVGPNSAIMYLHAGKLDDDQIGNIAAYIGEIGSQKNASKKTEVIACAQEKGEALGECSFKVKQGKEGKVTFTAIFSNGFKRKLFFQDSKFLKASMTMSGTGRDTDWKLTGDMHKIRVDDQRYDIPAALVAPTAD